MLSPETLSSSRPSCRTRSRQPRAAQAAWLLLLLAACGAASGARTDFSNEANDAAAGGSRNDEPETATAAPSEGSSVPALANAGPDLEVLRGSSVVLDGRRTLHPNGAQFSARWTQISGKKTVNLSNAARLQTSFTAPAEADVLTFRLITTVATTSFQDDVTVHVVESASRVAPAIVTTGDSVLNAGASTSLSAFLISGELSGDIQWQQRFGSPQALEQSGVAGRNLLVQAPASGVRVFAATAVFDGLSSAPDYAVVSSTTTSADDGAAAPSTTEAEGALPTELDELTVSPGAQVVLTTPTQLKASVWTQLAGDPVVLTAGEASWEFTAPSIPQVLWFSFTRDGTSLRTTPLVQAVIVSDDFSGQAEANAGQDLLVHPGRSISLDGTASVVPGNAAPRWTQSIGPLIELSSAQTTTPSFIAPAAPAQLVFLLDLVNTMPGSFTTTPPDSVVVTVRPLSENAAPTGTLQATAAGAQSFTVAAAVRDPDFDPFVCDNWRVSSGSATLAQTEGLQNSVTLTSPQATIAVTCSDQAASAELTLSLP